MIVEERIYTLHVGMLPKFMEDYEREGLPILKRHLGSEFGFFITEVGTQHQIVHIWAYENYTDFEQRRAALAADPALAIYRARNHPRVMLQETRIMRPAPYFEPIMKAMLKQSKV